MGVPVKADPTLEVGTPLSLFEGPYSTSTIRASYAVAVDGQRFLVVKPNQQESAWTQINVVLNWFEELKQKVPVE
ncbi:MAG: hypothetical protein A3H94_05905 [Acidobacteria bacterium RIFCSPLOWO2_02_FULL_60_20]|nr:MAG: hypothetical protein A3H94_05905 [Acidobacteria bacterium RIFCSPLOWO2_02_FULL_60_20]